jgi:hypothetical protein
MKLEGKFTLKPYVLMVFFSVSVWMLPLLGVKRFSVPNAIIGMQTAWAKAHYGIQGQTAPELRLDTWIDGNGQKAVPIYLNDYRGKVVYLYFFQNW